MTPELLPKKARVDGNMTGLSGELFVAAELLKHGLQTSITFGNAKQIDLFAHNPHSGKHFSIQVRSLRAKGYFPIREIRAEHIYVFVVLNNLNETVQYFIVSGQTLVDDPVQFDYKDAKFSGLHVNTLADFENCWNVFGHITV